MSGGSGEYVMGNYNNYSGYNSSYNSGFNGPYGNGGSLATEIPFPDDKYYNLYTSTSYTSHALTETSGWYNDSAAFDSIHPWLRRRRFYNDGRSAGVFSVFNRNGNADGFYSSRLSIVK